MSHLYKPVLADSSYSRKNWHGTYEEYQHALEVSTTLYVGNLSFFTREEQILELFSRVGDVKRIVMGLNKFELTPCGFCFVEYYHHEDAANCVNYISGTKLDDRVIRADWDTGFVEGRQFGRGSTGGQIRDELRDYFDPERGDKHQRVAQKYQQQQHHHQPSQVPPKAAPSHYSTHQQQYSPRHGAPSSSPPFHSSPPAYPPHHSSYHSHPHSAPGRNEGMWPRGEAPPGGAHPLPNEPPRRDDDRYGRDYRDSHRSGRDHGRGSYGRDYRSDHRDYDDYQGSRYKRRRDEDDYNGYSRQSAPLVDEFGRDLPQAKRPKLDESR